jgi:lipopolysaccharide export system permease protein
VTTLLVGIFYLVALNPIGAALANRLQQMENTLFSGQDSSLAISETGLWIREKAGERQSIIRAAHMDNIGQFQKITFQNFNKAGEFVSRMDSAHGVLGKGEWLLSKVVVYDNQNNRTVHSQLSVPTKLTIEKIKDSNTDPATLSVWRLPEFINILNQSGLSSLSYRLYFHSQFARLGMMISMVFLAAAFAMRPLRQGRAFIYVAVGVLGGFLMHFLSDIVYAMGLSDQIPVILAAWAPAMILFLVSATILVQVEEG